MASALRWVVPSICAILVAGPSRAVELDAAPSPLLAIDSNREAVVERIATQWSDALSRAGAGITRDQLREMLLGMRADQLLAASLVGSLDGLRDVIAASLVRETEVKPSLLHAKALGDANKDVVYVPVTPCRLVDTRAPYPAVYQNGGAFAGNEIRTYTLQGGNGVCLTQLPPSVTPSAVQMQVYGIPTTSGSGDIEILPQGGTFGSSATLVYLGSNAFTSASTTTPANLANKQVSVQVRGGGAHVAVDVVGFFRPPAGGFVSSVTAGAGLTGGTITSSGTIGLATTQLLPTVACATSQVPKWNGAAWICAADANSGGTVTSVAAGTGLAGGPITATGALAVATSFQLPQGCANGQVAKSNGSGAWACAADNGTVVGGATGEVLVGTGGAPAWSGSPSLSGSLTLVSSTAAAGNVMKGATQFLHNYGTANTFAGEGAGNFAMTGAANTGVGYIALQSNAAGINNTAVGSAALGSNTAGGRNTAAGASALASNIAGASNTAVGASALHFNTAANNTAVGDNALAQNTGGDSNAAFGWQAQIGNTSGKQNTAIGAQASTAATSGDQNTALGYQALMQNAAGSLNTALGAYAGYFATGSGNLYLANAGLAGEDATIRIGAGGHTRAFVAGVRGVTVGGAVNVFIDALGQLGTISSSREVKDDIADMGEASSVLMELRPVTFRYKAQAASDHLQYGLIAEEVAEVAPELVATRGDGSVETVYYQHLAPMLVNEYQKQQRAIEVERTQRATEIAQLRAERDAQAIEIAELKRAVEVLLARTSLEAHAAAK
ncbi:MAG: tail fiber domain-containing protein [Burkholderiales bacterium]